MVARQEIAVTTDRFVQTQLFLRHNERLEGIHMWWPHDPRLYDLTVEILVDGQVIDHMETYFGMRKVEVMGDKVLLNNHVLYQRLVLDQGYWPDGTAHRPQ